MNPQSSRRVVIATPEPLTHRRAGPAVRAIRIAEQLRNDGHRVTMASTATDPPEATIDGVATCGLDGVPRDHDVYLVTGRAMLDLDWLDRSEAVLGVDLYDPFQLEALHRGGDDRIRRIDLVEGAGLTLATQLVRGDKFFCANETQRSLWLGYLGAAGRLNPAIHDHDPAAYSLIDLAPFGVDDGAPKPGPSPVRALAGIGPDDPVALWAGGLHDWLDPVTAVRAAARVTEAGASIRLVFVAGRAPAGDEPTQVQAVRHEAAALGVLDRSVFVLDDWIPHDDRGALLTDAAMGVCTHGAHLETRFSHRTRFLDHLWAGLPTVTTGGDPLSAELAAHGAAQVVAPGDHVGLADAMMRVVTDPEHADTMGAAARELADRWRWPEVLEPLRAWVRDAAPAPDRLDPALVDRIGRAGQSRSLPARLRLQWQTEGPRGVARRAVGRARRTIGR